METQTAPCAAGDPLSLQDIAHPKPKLYLVQSAAHDPPIAKQITSDPSPEAAIAAFIGTERWLEIEHDPLKPEDFSVEHWGIIYRAARQIWSKKTVCISSINEWIEEHCSLEFQRSMGGQTVNWRDWWSEAQKQAGLGTSLSNVLDACERVARYARNREEYAIRQGVGEGSIDWPEAFERIEKLHHGQNGENEKGTALFDFRNLELKADNTLLGNRFLCRGGGMLFIGPSGMGKSSASVQQDIEWCMGRTSFGIKPGKSLKIVTIQAEDDEGDIHEMVEGVCRFLQITPEQQREARDRCIYIPCKSLTGQDFIDFVRKVLKTHKPDLLRINPLQAYLGADIKDPEKTAAFLRNGLNPLLEEFNCAVIIVHHTPKTNFRDTEEWKVSDWMYAGAGSADITNWARAILIADPTDNPQVFQWIAAKRGKRIGWADKDGNPIDCRHFSHSSSNGIHWDDTEAIDLPEEKKKKRTKPINCEEIISLLPPLPLEVFRSDFNRITSDSLHVGINRAKEFIASIIENHQVKLIRKPRAGTKPAEFLQRIS